MTDSDLMAMMAPCPPGCSCRGQYDKEDSVYCDHEECDMEPCIYEDELDPCLFDPAHMYHSHDEDDATD